MLRVEDSVKDRLASYFYWNDRQGLDQAVEICAGRKIDISEVRRWAEKEGFLKKFDHFLDRVKNK